MNKKIKTHEDADHIVDLKIQREGTSEWLSSDSITYPSDKTSVWKVKVKPPEALQGSNIQFVIEAESTFNDGSSKGSTFSGANFEFPKMCEGRRSFARNYNEGVTLEIDGTADSVELWAAWAIGFGQVSLTPRLVLMKGDVEEEEEL